MGLQNLVKENTCFTKNHASSIDIFLTNRPTLFQKTGVIGTGLSDYHGLVVTFFKIQIPRLKGKRVTYRNYKYFNESDFLSDVRMTNFETDNGTADDAYDHITKTFRALVDKHAHLKTKVLRGNTAPFMNRGLRKGIYTRSRLQKKFKKHPSKENEIKFKKQRNKCVSLRKKAIRNHFKNATSNGIVSNQDFWKLVNPYLSNKGGLHGNDITLVKGDKIITNDKELAEVFNDHYIYIVEKSSGKKPSSIAEIFTCLDDR